MRSLQDYIAAAREYLDEPSEASGNSGDQSDSGLAKHINREMISLATFIADEKQDYFGQHITVPLVTNTYEYWIPSGIIRYVEVFTSGVTSLGNGLYSYAESSSNHYELDRLETLKDKDIEFFRISENRVRGGCGYFQWGGKLVIGTGSNDITTGNYLRIWMIPDLADIHYGTMVSAGADTLVINRAGITNDLNGNPIGSILQQSNAYLGYGTSIYSASVGGAGQERTIIADEFDGTDHTFTLDRPWDVVPSATVAYSLIPPFPKVFDDALEIGAAIRARIKPEDSSTEMLALYEKALTIALKSIVPRNRHGTRTLRRVKWRG